MLCNARVTHPASRLPPSLHSLGPWGDRPGQTLSVPSTVDMSVPFLPPPRQSSLRQQPRVATPLTRPNLACRAAPNRRNSLTPPAQARATICQGCTNSIPEQVYEPQGMRASKARCANHGVIRTTFVRIQIWLPSTVLLRGGQLHQIINNRRLSGNYEHNNRYQSENNRESQTRLSKTDHLLLLLT